MILEKLPRSVILCSLSIAAVLIAVVWVTFVTIAFAIMYLYTHVCGDACVFVYLRMCEEREKGEGVLRFRSVKIARSCPKSQNRQALIGLIERCNYFFFSIKFSFADTDDWKESRRREVPSFISLYHFFPLLPLSSFKHLTVTLHLRWLQCNFNRSTCNYQTVTSWDLSISRNQQLLLC